MASTFSHQQIQAAVAALKSYKPTPVVSHEWEELVVHLSHDHDPHMRERMYREMDEIIGKDPWFILFRID